MDSEQRPFAALLRRLREERNLSLRQVEAVTGISNGYISQIESGHAGAPSPKIIEKLARAFDHSYLEMMKAAGYLSTDVPSEPILRLGGEIVPLTDLSQEDQKKLLEFVRSLRRTRQRSSSSNSHNLERP